MEQQDGLYDAACCIYATAPFVRQQDLARGRKCVEDGWAFAFPVTDFPAPIVRSFRLFPGGGLEMLYPEHLATRSQDLETAYHDAGQFYWGTVAAWRCGQPLFGSNSAAIQVPRRVVQDIDTEEDWIIAERMYLIGRE